MMLFNRKNCFIVFASLLSCWTYAQKNKADKLYDNAQYFKAIPKYEKAIKTGDTETKKESFIKLADCYRLLNEYKKAEDCYKEALALGNVSPDVRYNYGNVLKSNNKYTEALLNYTAYLEAKPTDQKAANAIKSCQEIKYWQSKPQEYQIKLVEGINTKHSEFCPALLNNKFVYVSEKQQDFVEYTTTEMNGEPYLNVLYTEIKNIEKGKSKPLSKRINTNYHDGPISFSQDGKTIYLTRVNYEIHKKQKDFVNRAKLYTYTGNNRRWHDLNAFQYNSDSYSCAHASISADGNTLYFTSDMPGGFGGKDIWMCKKGAQGWDKPVNLGADINTSGDEMFPYIRKDGVLFFSSNGLPGFGGLDIFSAKDRDGIWLLNRNEGLYLNSSADDFGVLFMNDSTGYFSSNREGGKGKDDIYAFVYTNKYGVVDGTVLLTENMDDPAKDVKVYLLDDKGRRLDSTRTNSAGYFAFKNLEIDKSYLAQIADDEVTLKNKSRYYLADKNKNIMRVTHTQNGQKFVFRNLPIDVSELSDLYTDDDLTLGGNLLYGENPTKPLANKKVIIKNDYGDVMEETKTNEFGAFVFRNLPFDQNYTLTVEADDLLPDIKIRLTNKSGKEVKVVRTDAKGKFHFSLLSIDKSTLSDLDIEDADMMISLKGYLYDQNKKPLNKANVTIFNSKEIIETMLTDENGRFQFTNMNFDRSYLFSIEDTDVRFTNVSKIYIADAKGRIYRELIKSTNGKFQFQLLAIDKTTLGDFTIDDPWLDLLNMKNKKQQETITIIENLTYAYDDYKIDAAGKNILDKVITVLNKNPNLNIELSSHTDSRSTDSYNLQLSEKRAKAAVDYLISKGVNKKRLKAIGYGETKLLNKCSNDVPCSEEEHAQNRRTEFKIVEVRKN